MRLLLIALLLSSTLHAQDPAEFLKACSTPDAIVPDKFRPVIFNEKLLDPREKVHVAMAPIPLAEGNVTVVYSPAFSQGNSGSRIRGYSLMYVNSNAIVNDIEFAIDDVVPDIKPLHNTFLKYMGMARWQDELSVGVDAPSEVSGYCRIWNGKLTYLLSLTDQELRDQVNVIFGFYNKSLTEDELNEFFAGDSWFKDQVRKKVINGVEEEDARLLEYLQTNGPGPHGRLEYVGNFGLLKKKGATFSASTLSYGGWRLFPATTGEDYQKAQFTVNMSPIDLNGGQILGVIRTPPSPALAGGRFEFGYIFYWKQHVGTSLNFYGGNTSGPPAEPTVTIIQDRFIKMMVDEGSKINGREKISTYYGILSDKNLYLINRTPKEELAFHRNYIFARYGYKFQKPVYQAYFSKFDWYHPQYDNVDKMLTPDEIEIVKQCIAAEAVH